ncbi:MAG: type II secretion system protein [Alphaproteobacteria bacterium]|nr:type II secretion system protein [Alphaproteobacteria bacterium]
MSVKNKTNKNYKRSQKGRSMVEMLGVLAIVGVLSVGGVYGYGVAMKKHKANELLHQASMLATTISAQAMTNDGKLPERITDFGNTSYGKFQSAVGETADKTGFTITISELDGSVCSQLKEGGMVQKVECNPDAKTATLTYYKNLATNDEEGKNSPTGKKPECSPACQEGQQCIGGVCATVTPEAGNGCSKNSDCDDWCVKNGGGKECYCKITAKWTTNASDCYNNFTGQCAVATPQSGISGGYTVSEDWMTWWSAVNFCKAHDKSLVSLADLGITGGGAYCANNFCTGTFTWSDLEDKVGYNYCWTTDAASCDENFNCTLENNNNTCYAVAVFIGSNYISPTERDDISLDYKYALCVD